MASDSIPTCEPGQITAGYSVKWKKFLGDWPASEYQLKYVLRPESGSGSAIELSSTASGEYHLVSLSPSATQGYAPGRYSAIAFVEDRATSGATTKQVIYETEIEIVADPASTSSVADLRSYVRQVRDKLRETFLQLSANTLSAATVNGKTYTKVNLGELRAELSRYEDLVRQEEARARIAAGCANPNKVLVRFNNPL